jgi:hypothetical protein
MPKLPEFVDKRTQAMSTAFSFLTSGRTQTLTAQNDMTLAVTSSKGYVYCQH